MTRPELIAEFEQFVEILIDKLVDKPSEVTQTNRLEASSKNLSSEVLFFSSGIRFRLRTITTGQEDTYFLELSARNPIEGSQDVIRTFDFVRYGKLTDFAVLVDTMNILMQEFVEKIKNRLNVDEIVA